MVLWLFATVFFFFFYIFCPVRCFIVVFSGSCLASQLAFFINQYSGQLSAHQGRYRFIKNDYWGCDHLVGEEGTGCFALFGLWLVYCLSLFSLPLSVICRLWSVFVATPGQLLYGPRHAKTCLRAFADSKDPAQSEHPRKLNRAFTIR